jgi:DeoR/GlpR family transcriptional regulator of sugar metabolism
VNTPEQLGRIENRLIVETTHGGAVLVDPVSDTRERLPAIQCDEAVLEEYKMMLAEKVLHNITSGETPRV